MASDVNGHEEWTSLTGELRRRLGTGAPLEPAVRRRFEGQLGADLSTAMIHRSPLGGYLARALGAQALTVGEHVVGDTQLDASTSSGAALLGHELTHTLQRDSGALSEASALSTEQALLAAPPAVEQPGAIDVDDLAERVYRLLLTQLLTERDRGWVL